MKTLQVVYLLLVHERHESGRCCHGILRSQLVSSAYLDVNLDKSDKTWPRPSSLLLGNFFKSRFYEAAGSTGGGCKKRNDGAV